MKRAVHSERSRYYFQDIFYITMKSIHLLAVSLLLLAGISLPAHAIGSAESAPAPAEQSAAACREPEIADFFI
jgi:hypothetical protein